MKKIAVTLSILLIFAVGASAQMSKPFTVYAGAGLSFPMSDGLKSVQNTGFHGSVGVGFNAMPMLQIVGKIEYHSFAADQAEYSLALGTTEDVKGGTFAPLMFGVDGRYAFSLPAAPFAPYAFGGIGLARISWSDITYGSTTLSFEDQTKMYFNVGAGVEFDITPAASLFVQGRYVNIATEGEATTMIPFTVGLKF
jgi:opacity protein-like surface antigen